MYRMYRYYPGLILLAACLLLGPVSGPAGAAEPLTFKLTAAIWSVSGKLIRVSSGLMTVTVDGEVYSTAAIVGDGQLTFTLPSDQSSELSLQCEGLATRSIRAEITDGVLALFNRDAADDRLHYEANPDGTYSLEYYQDYLYLCGQGDALGPIMGRTYEPRYRFDVTAAEKPIDLNGAQPKAYFEENRGQTDPRVRFRARGTNHGLLLTEDGAWLTLEAPAGKRLANGLELDRSAVKMDLEGASKWGRPRGWKKLPGRTSYFRGTDPEKWQRGVSTFAQVRYERVYPKIDLVFRAGEKEGVAYDFVVGPGGDPGLIRLSFSGQEKLSLSPEGDLILETGLGRLVQKKPKIFQEKKGVKEPVTGRFALLGNGRVGFELADYDKTEPLTIDPDLIAASYFGGSGPGAAQNVAVDSAGNVYVGGSVGDPGNEGFPTVAGSYTSAPVHNLDLDVFVVKLSPDMSTLIYSVYFGGNRDEETFDLKVDSSGSAYVAGGTDDTQTSGIPYVGGYLAGGREDEDAFVVKINPAGDNLVYTAYWGGTESEYVYSITLDSAGCVYAVGRSDDPDGNSYTRTAGAYVDASTGQYDAFMTKLSADGSTAVFSTYFGGTANDAAYGVAVDSTGIYVGGTAQNPRGNDFPADGGGLSAGALGSDDIWAVKFDTNGANILYSAVFGGDSSDWGLDLALRHGSVYLTGSAHNHPDGSHGWPNATGYVGGNRNGDDVFVAKLNTDGTALDYLAIFGGQGEDVGNRLVVDAWGNVSVICSAPWPTASEFAQGQDHDVYGQQFTSEGVLAQLDPTGSQLLATAFFGGISPDEPFGVAHGPDYDVYVAGYSTNPGAWGFPLTSGAFNGGTKGLDDPYVLRFSGLASAGIPSGGPYGSWGGGRNLFWTELFIDLTAWYLDCLAAGGECRLSLAWPFEQEPEGTMPGLYFAWVYPDGTTEESFIPIGRSGTTGHGTNWATYLGLDVGVQHVVLDRFFQPSFLTGLASGTHTLIYGLRNPDGSTSNLRYQTLRVP